jgi:hypothetical protein
MKANIKRVFFLAGIVFISSLFLNNTYINHLDLGTGNENPVSGTRKFDFRYSGIVGMPNGVMPLVGQLSKDGLKLYFTSQNMRGAKQLYVMSRTKTGEPFGVPVRLKGVGDEEGYDIVMPTVSGDENILVFVNSKDGTQRGNDLYIASKSADGFDSIRPLDEINDPGISDSYPWISKDGLRLYFTKQKGSNITFHVAERKSIHEKFSAPSKLEIAISEANNNLSCVLSSDEKEIFILNGDKILHATRQSVKEKFSAPVVIATSKNDAGFMNGITITDNTAELYVFNSVGFRNTQILKFDNAAFVPTVQKLAENKTLEITE